VSSTLKALLELRGMVDGRPTRRSAVGRLHEHVQIDRAAGGRAQSRACGRRARPRGKLDAFSPLRQHDAVGLVGQISPPTTSVVPALVHARSGRIGRMSSVEKASTLPVGQHSVGRFVVAASRSCGPARTFLSAAWMACSFGRGIGHTRSCLEIVMPETGGGFGHHELWCRQRRCAARKATRLPRSAIGGGGADIRDQICCSGWPESGSPASTKGPYRDPERGGHRP